MAIGHVTLDGREYVVTDPKQIGRDNANQVSAKLGSSAGDYDDLEEWSAWVMDDWRVGIGQGNADAGGTLFSSLETRFEGQFLLPGKVVSTVGGSVGWDNTDKFITIGSGQTYTKATVYQTVAAGKKLSGVTLYTQARNYHGTATQAKVELWTNSGSNTPNTLIEAKTLTLLRTFPNLGDEIGYYKYTVGFTPVTPGADTVYHVVIYPVSGTLSLPYTEGSPGKMFDGAAWIDGLSYAVTFHKDAPYDAGSISHIEGFNNECYVAAGLKLFKDGSGGWILLKTYGTAITDLLAVGSKLYIGLGDSTNYDTMSTGEAFTAGTVPARLFTLWNGLLYRAVTTEVHYTNDEVTWKQVSVADPGFTVTGMSGFQDEVIVASENALFRIAAGDVVLSITRWPTNSLNGKYMTNFQGNLFISQGKSLLRYDGASILPFGLDLGEGLPTEFHGSVMGLAHSNNWLFCAIQGLSSSSHDWNSVWAHNGQGWHHIMRVPIGSSGVTSLGYVPNRHNVGTETPTRTEQVIAGTGVGYIFGVRVPDTARSTYKVAAESFYQFDLAGALETDWFYGGLREVKKDFESVYADAENLEATERYMEVYWQDDGSTGWELLGNITDTVTELRWSNPSTRPASRKIKLKLSLVTGRSSVLEDLGVKIIAVRVKYRPMIRDRFRWRVNLLINEDQILIDGAVQTTYTIAQQLAHLDGLINQVPPFVFKDVDGFQYNVMITAHQRVVLNFDFYGASKQNQYMYVLTLEQVNAGTV